YLRRLSGDALAGLGAALINAMIFWDILYRSQQGVSVSFVEDIWTQNIVNLLVSPLRLREWIAATFLYGLMKTALIVCILTAIAGALYHFYLLDSLHFWLLPLVFNLLLFGWALGIFTASLVIRWGHAAEALIWGIPFLVQPFSAIFYPLDVLPAPMRAVSRLLPSTYVFEGMREVIRTGSMPAFYFWTGFGLDLVYFALAGLFFGWMFRQARDTGRLGRLGTD
ncbi:MAG TPA: ABC transporter permease, partial [Candidatus Eisenbacteria bacterium]|nr:ABC transporter permease [Candidatus Eisenbacteria bacterium]